MTRLKVGKKDKAKLGERERIHCVSCSGGTVPLHEGMWYLIVLPDAAKEIWKEKKLLCPEKEPGLLFEGPYVSHFCEITT